MQIPLLFPIFIFFPWRSTKFPDFCQVWNFPDFSLTAGWTPCNIHTHPTPPTSLCWGITSNRPETPRNPPNWGKIDTFSDHLKLKCNGWQVCVSFYITLGHGNKPWKYRDDTMMRISLYPCDRRTELFIVDLLGHSHKWHLLILGEVHILCLAQMLSMCLSMHVCEGGEHRSIHFGQPEMPEIHLSMVPLQSGCQAAER